jgi:hypothetical protein
MIFIIPVSGADFDKLPKFVKVLQKLGGLKEHKGILVPTADVAERACQIARPLEMLFGEYREIKLTTTPKGGWPGACNVHFKLAVSETMASLDSHWMWLELDSCPLKEGWANALHWDYINGGTAFRGYVNDTSSFSEFSGTHMVGFGMYPKDFYARTVLWQYPPEDIPFDIFMRDAIRKDVSVSPMISHIWGSREYHYHHDGFLYGKDRHGNLQAVSKTAVIVHGVKDDSLYDLILNDEKIEEITPSKSEYPLSLEEMASILRENGYAVVTPDALEDPPQSTETLTAFNDEEDIKLDNPVVVSDSPPPSTTVNVQLPKRRGRPKLVK